MNKNSKILILTAIIIVSLAGGIIGGILVRSYFLNSSFNVPLLGDINLSSAYRGGNLIISQPGKVIVEQDDRIASVIDDARKSLVDFYQIKKSAGNESELNPRSFYFKQDKIGQGLALTSDGWIVTSVKIDRPENFIAIDYEGTVMPLESITVYQNERLVKITAKNLSAVQFADKDNLHAGQTVIIPGGGRAVLSSIEDINGVLLKSPVKSSDSWSWFIKISDSLSAPGDPVFNLSGSLVGIYQGDGLLAPMTYYSQLLSAVLNKKTPARAYLGINYIDLSAVGQKITVSGALVAADSRGVAVIKNSPAALAGLREGDIITAVDGVKVDAKHDLSQIINGYQPEEKIEISFLREEREQLVKIILGSLK